MFTYKREQTFIHLVSFYAYELIAIMIIIAGVTITYVHNQNYNFLPCEYECGETLIAESEARNVRMFGLKFGLLEDWATSPSVEAHPFHYTHNVNMGSLSFISMELLGIKEFSTKQTLIILIWAVGLLYAYLCISHFSSNKFCGIVALLFLVTDFAFGQTYTTHALRTWQWLPIFGLPWHLSRYISNQKKRDVLGVLILICVSFGVGYDFWITMIFCSIFVTIFSFSDFSRINVYKILKILKVFFILAILPFCLRQLHIIFVMGYKYWIIDFYNSIGIKIPYFSKFIHVPQIADLDTWYREHNVARPPASPVTAEVLLNILNMAKNSIFYVLIPSAGILTFLATIIAIIMTLSSRAGFFNDKIKNSSTTINLEGICGYITAMVFGYACGLLITPSVSILYLLYVPPLIIAPLVASKSLFTTLLGRRAILSIQKKQVYNAISFLILVLFAFVDHIKVQIGNLHSVKRMDTSWVSLIRSMPGASFAVPYIQQAAAAFSNNWAVAVRGPGYQYEYFDAIKDGKPPFSQEDLAFFGEKNSNEVDYTKPDYFLYYSIDQRINMFDPEPECREDYLISFARSYFYKPNHLIQNISFNSGISNGKDAFVVSGKTTTSYINDIEILMGNAPPQKLVYNCISRTFQGLFTISSLTSQKIPYRIYVNQKDKKILAYQAQFEAIPEKRILVAPVTRQPLISDILRKYKNSNLKITSYKKGNKEYEGYVLVDLRELYKKSKI